MEKKIAIIGAGNLGLALTRGILDKELVQPGYLTLTRRNIEKIASWQAAGVRLTSSNHQAVADSDIIIICVQPKQLTGLLAEVGHLLDAQKHTLVSVVTGIPTDEIISALDGKKIPVIRAMPNTAIAIGESMTCICHRDASAVQLNQVMQLFGALGRTLLVEERLMKAATVLAASGVAFFMRYVRAATQGGIQLGFDAEDAQAIAVQTAKGAAALLQANGSHPEMEIDKVTTPEGCTIAGLNEMEHQGLSSALIKGILTSFEKINNIRQ